MTSALSTKTDRSRFVLDESGFHLEVLDAGAFRMFFDMTARFYSYRCGFRRHYDSRPTAEIGLLAETQSDIADGCAADLAANTQYLFPLQFDKRTPRKIGPGSNYAPAGRDVGEQGLPLRLGPGGRAGLRVTVTRPAA